MSVPLKKLEDQLNCPICLDTLTNPKQLHCNHVYCQKCLVRLVTQDQQGRLSLTCPNCRQVMPVPASGVAGLQPAICVSQLLEIVGEHKKIIMSSEKIVIESPSTSPTQHQNSTTVCLEHGRKEVLLYCETCEKAICWECIMKGNKHHSHDYEKLEEAFDQYKREITSSLEPLEKQLITIEESLKVFDACHDEILSQRAANETDIHNTITRLQVRLHQTLEVRRTELISRLDQLTQAKLKSLETQRDQIETTQTQLRSCLLFIKENLKTGNKGEALKMKSTTVKQVNKLTSTFQPDMLEPKSKADVMFSALADLTADCQKYGIVYVSGPPDPSKCYITGQKVDTGVVAENSTAILQTMNIDSQPCMSPVTSISCELVSEIAGTRATGSVDKRGQSQFEISYQPTIKGRHQLHIKVEGQHIRGSSFPVSVRSPVVKLSTPILTISGVREPLGIAVNKQGYVVVTMAGHCITVFSPSGERLQSFGRHGSGPGQFNHPRGVAVDAEGNIFVADCHNHRIQKFTAQGEFVKAVGTKGSGPLQFSYPIGIVVNASNGKVYVVENGNNRIHILDPELGYSRTFGNKGSGKGQFIYPWYIACDSTGNVYVADTDNFRIQVFTAEWDFLRMFGRHGDENTDQWWARGIAVDSSNRMYVCDERNHSVSVFTSDSQFVTLFGSRGRGPGQFQNPQGLAVDSSEVVYVCDQYNNRIQLF